MPPHSSYLLQPLDVGCFGPLKKAYGRQVENLTRSYINHITKLEFLPAFKQPSRLLLLGRESAQAFEAQG
jgi:hypothetical protein